MFPACLQVHADHHTLELDAFQKKYNVNIHLVCAWYHNKWRETQDFVPGENAELFD
jgi:hypothetical protein